MLEAERAGAPCDDVDILRLDVFRLTPEDVLRRFIEAFTRYLSRYGEEQPGLYMSKNHLARHDEPDAVIFALRSLLSKGDADPIVTTETIDHLERLLTMEQPCDDIDAIASAFPGP
jgi:hypothetical protein